MASEWARKSAKRLMDSFICDDVASALDEAREEGAQRERWACHQLAAMASENCGSITDDFCPRCGFHVADAIAARGPMLGPEEE